MVANCMIDWYVSLRTSDKEEDEPQPPYFPHSAPIPLAPLLQLYHLVVSSPANLLPPLQTNQWSRTNPSIRSTFLKLLDLSLVRRG